MKSYLRGARWGALLASLPVIAGAQAERRTLTGDRVAIYNLAGKLTVQPGSGSQVAIDITRGGRDGSQLKIAAGDIRGSQTLRVIYPSNEISYATNNRNSRTTLRVNSDGTFNEQDGGDSWGRSADRVEIRDSDRGLDAHADLVVSVPKGQRLAIHWGVGETAITNVDGDLRVSVAASRVTSNHTSGRLTLETGSGTVDVSDAQGDVALATGSGGVTLHGIRGENLDVETGSGHVRGDDVDVRSLKLDVGSGGIQLARIKSARATVESGSGGADLGFLSVVSDVSVETGSGGVTLHLAADQGGDVDIQTSSGGINSDFPVQTTRIERGALRGRIGTGNGRIKIESGSGGVRLLKN
jgi:hypothetical protein